MPEIYIVLAAVHILAAVVTGGLACFVVTLCWTATVLIANAV